MAPLALAILDWGSESLKLKIILVRRKMGELVKKSMAKGEEGKGVNLSQMWVLRGKSGL